MKGGFSCGIDGIDGFSIKLAAPLIEDALLHLVNLSIRTSLFPETWKHQLIFPQHKKKDKLLVENYRPVCHLNEIGLLTERAIYEQIVAHFTQNDLFHPNHHGGLANHSTTTALIQIYDHILCAAEEKKLSALLLLDQTAAYDLLDHRVLLDKLKQYGFDEKSVYWMNTYLTGRSQCVQIQSKLSPSIISLASHGAPQGSLLGGLLFVINENDFPNCREEGESVLFVDDDSDIVHDADSGKLLEKIQKEADLSCSWLHDNRMCVAGDKSKLLIIGTEELKRTHLQGEPMFISVDGKIVNESTHEKSLGIMISNNLTWKDHLHSENNGLLSVLSKRLGLIKKTFAVL